MSRRKVHAHSDMNFFMDESFGKRLQKARKLRGFASPEEVIERYPSWKLDTYKSHEFGRRAPRLDTVKAYAKSFAVRWQWLLDNDGPMKDGTLTDTMSAKQPVQPVSEKGSLYPENIYDLVPLYGPASAGLEKVYISGENVIGERARPPELQGVKGGFRMLIKGDCMEPRHFDGEEVSVHPFKKPAINDDCVLVMEPDGDAQVKRYLGETSKEVRLMQWNPRKEIIVAKKNIRHIYAVVR